MRAVVTALASLAIGMAVSGCSIRSGNDGYVSQRLGSNFVGAGGLLNLTEPVAGDAFVVGGHVSIATEVHGDLLAAGGELSIGGNVGEDLYAAGGNVKLDAIVTGNARIAGGSLAVGPATVVAGALSLTGGHIEFDGDAHRHLQASGTYARLNGIVHGDAEVRAQQVVIGPDTRIGGRLIVRSARKPTMPQGAVIAGGVEFHEIAPGRGAASAGEKARHLARGAVSVLWFAGVFLAGALFLLVFPDFSVRAAQTVGREPLTALALGVAVLVCVPVIALSLIVTLIGIPLALLLCALYLVLLCLGWVTTAQFVGQKVLAVLHRAQPSTTGGRLIALFAALVLLGLLGRIPHVGGWITGVALLAGMGALVRQAWSQRTGTLRRAA